MKRYAISFAISAMAIFIAPVFAGHKEHAACESECANCAKVCQEALDYCLKKGGDFAKKEHVNLMKDCIMVCKANADLQSRSSKYTDAMSKICASVCKECAESCTSLKDKKLADCAQTCKKCFECCSD